MKQGSVRTSVMQQVVRYEKKRTAAWYLRFSLIIVALLAAFSGAIYWVIAILSERQTLELLELFGQDREIIAAYWQDTVMIILEELPRRPVLLAGIVVVLLVGVWFFTAKRRKKLATIRSQLETYEKRR